MDVHFILCFINCDIANLAHDLFKNCPFSPMNKNVLDSNPWFTHMYNCLLKIYIMILIDLLN